MPRTFYFCSGAGQGLCTETTGAPPPTGWTTLAFDDSSWTVPVARTTASGDNFHFAISIPGALYSAAVQADHASVSLPRVGIFRYKFTLPKIPGLTITSATLLVNCIEQGDSSGSYAIGYINGNNVGIPVDTFPSSAPFSLTIPASSFVAGENIFAMANYWDVPYNGGIQFGLTITISDPPPDWLVTVEPSVGVTRQGKRLFMGDNAQHTFQVESRKRGSANYTLSVAAGDSYEPTIGQQIWLYDQNKGGFTLAFTGLLQSFKNRQIGINGDRFIDCVATSLEVVLDQQYAEPQQFLNQTCGQILTALYNRYLGASQVSLGTISDGVTIPEFNTNYEKLSELATQLATTSGFVWGVDPPTQEIFFCLPGTVAAPLTLTSNQALWDSINWEYDASDYRNRQAMRLSYDAFTHSGEFFVGSGQTQFTLLRAVDQVTNAYVTLSTPNKAYGKFSGQPSPGDTVTVGPFTGSGWPGAGVNTTLGGIIVVNGYVFKVTTAGTTGSSQPKFIDLTGATTTDNTTIWTCQGALGLSTGVNTYTFCLAYDPTQPNFGIWQPDTTYSSGQQVYIVAGMAQQITTPGTTGATQPTWNNTIGGTTTDGTATWTCLGPWLDNTQYGLVLIDPNGSATATCTNLVDALNSNAATRGTTFSLPTWENSQGNAISQVGQQFEFESKAAGSSQITSLSYTGSAFSWVNGSSPSTAVTQTSGGTSPQGSVGPNQGATVSIQVYAVGTNTAAPSLSFTQGSNIVNLATPLNPGTNLNIEYTRPDGNVIEVENTPLVEQLAATTFGTGEVQQISDQSSQGLVSTNAEAGLQLAQQALAAFDIVPLIIDGELLQPGILPGQLLTLALSGAMAVINGTYFVQEVSGQLVPVWHEGVGMDSIQAPQAGHYRYTLKLIDVAQIGSYLDFWEGMGGGGSGAGGGGAMGGGIAQGLSATSGGIQAPQASSLTTGGTKLLTGAYTVTAADYGLLLSFNLSGAATCSLPALPFTPQFPQFSIHVENTSASANLTLGVPIGFTIDGASGGLVIPPSQGVYLTTDGNNYFTERGITQGSIPGAMIQIASVTVATLTNKVSFPSIPGSYNHLQIWITAAASDGVWQANFAYTVGTIIVQLYTATSTYYYWKVTAASGNSGGSIPAFSTHNSGTLTDGGVTWTNEGSDTAVNIDAAMVLNNDLSGSNYYRVYSLQESSYFGGSQNPVSSPPSNGPSCGVWLPTPRNARPQIPVSSRIDIPFYKNTVFGKSITSVCTVQTGGSGAGLQSVLTNGIGYLPASAISEIDFYVEDGTYFAAGSSFILYGIN